MKNNYLLGLLQMRDIWTYIKSIFSQAKYRNNGSRKKHIFSYSLGLLPYQQRHVVSLISHHSEQKRQKTHFLGDGRCSLKLGEITTGEPKQFFMLALQVNKTACSFFFIKQDNTTNIRPHIFYNQNEATLQQPRRCWEETSRADAVITNNMPQVPLLQHQTPLLF